jgi:acyl carrier protein
MKSHYRFQSVVILETGIVLTKNFDPYDQKWKHMHVPEVRKPYLRIESPLNAQNPNEKLLVHLSNDPFLAENVSNSSDGCYIVSDILLEDPPQSGQYMILGRQDDTLVHINGEKTNPLPMEDIIRCSSLVKQVAIVGHNQFCTAALIQLDVDEMANYDSNRIEATIWEIIEKVNKQAPSHSHLSRGLIEILPVHRTLPVTDKGNLMRRRVTQEYSTLITTMYDKFFNRQQQELRNELIDITADQHQSIWTQHTVNKYLEEKLMYLASMHSTTITIDSSRSIFDYGINSLQVVELRNLICQDITEIPMNFIYEYSAVEQMVEPLLDYLTNRNVKVSNQQQNDPYHYELTEKIIDKYIDLMAKNDLSRKRTETIETKVKPNSERTFLVTGANGSLGNFIIRDLLRQSSSIVKRVYCLLRGSDTEHRLFESFRQRELDTTLLTESLKQRLIILNSSMDLNEGHLGQIDDVYRELQNNVTDIIHSAWKMNFNQTVKDFEYDSIFGVYNLLTLAASNAIQFHFVSSVASAGSWVLDSVKEAPLPRKTHVALPQGYGQSKYASEHLCWAAMNLWSKIFSHSFSYHS